MVDISHIDSLSVVREKHSASYLPLNEQIYAVDSLYNVGNVVGEVGCSYQVVSVSDEAEVIYQHLVIDRKVLDDGQTNYIDT
ncbi:MAG: hypothetical protein P8O97_04265 [Gammaproteobacteria bacterium]|nr:hypothetical protein [Gammaproteobacteria bacterium]